MLKRRTLNDNIHSPIHHYQPETAAITQIERASSFPCPLLMGITPEIESYADRWHRF